MSHFFFFSTSTGSLMKFFFCISDPFRQYSQLPVVRSEQVLNLRNPNLRSSLSQGVFHLISSANNWISPESGVRCLHYCSTTTTSLLVNCPQFLSLFLPEQQVFFYISGRIGQLTSSCKFPAPSKARASIGVFGIYFFLWFQNQTS